MVNPRKKPKFGRQGANYLKKVEDKWRRPRGLHSKLKLKQKSKGAMPKIGYGAPRSTKGLHPSGLREVYIQNLNDLKKIDNKTDAGRISAQIGKKKKMLIVEKAKEWNIKILNP